MTNKEAVENNYVALFEAFDVNDPAWDIIIKVLGENIPGFKVSYGFGDDMAFAIPKNWEENLPSAQPQRKRGKWIVYYECPICGEITNDFKEYCPFCCGDMRGEEDGS